MTNTDYQTDVDVRYAFDNLGRMTSRVDNAGTWSWTYDGASHRVTSETLRNPTGEARAVSYAYDPATYDLASVACGAYTTRYAWAAGRLTNVSWNVGTVVSGVRYGYLPNSDLLLQMANDQGLVTTRAYDLLSRLTGLTNDFGSSGSAFNYVLDSTGRRIARSDFEKVSGLWSPVSSLSWKYDAFDQLTNAVRTGSANGAADAAYRFGYKYDLIGNRLHEDRGQLDLDGAFNNLNQLTALDWSGRLDVLGSVGATGVVVKVSGTDAVMYDGTNYLGAGNVSKPGSNNIPIVAWLGTNSTEANRTVYMPPAKPQAFLYDLNGNLTNDGQRAYHWDEENRLVAVETQGDAGIPACEKKRSEYLYDAQSRRIQKRDLSNWTGSAYATTNVTGYVWDGWLLLAETDAAGSVSVYHVHGLDLSQTLQGAGGIGGLLARVAMTNDQSPMTFSYAFDGNGNVADVTASGAVAAHYEYDPFGRTVSESGPYAAANPWRFSTKQTDDWGLYYYGLRFYSPNLGRWLSRDPIGEMSGPNLYAYVNNLPIMVLDPLGQAPLECEADTDKDCTIKSRRRRYSERGEAQWDPRTRICTCSMRRMWEIIYAGTCNGKFNPSLGWEICSTWTLVPFSSSPSNRSECETACSLAVGGTSQPNWPPPELPRNARCESVGVTEPLPE
jgi:RHS repeat-associated protein